MQNERPDSVIHSCDVLLEIALGLVGGRSSIIRVNQCSFSHYLLLRLTAIAN
jgi:Golgi nucleoside diphosphatase